MEGRHYFVLAPVSFRREPQGYKVDLGPQLVDPEPTSMAVLRTVGNPASEFLRCAVRVASKKGDVHTPSDI
jgi:hypothetical protein